MFRYYSCLKFFVSVLSFPKKQNSPTNGNLPVKVKNSNTISIYQLYLNFTLICRFIKQLFKIFRRHSMFEFLISFIIPQKKPQNINRIGVKCLFVSCFLCWSGWTAESSNPFPLNKALIQKLKKQGGQLLSDRMGEYILRAENLANDKKYDKAIDLLEYHYNKASSAEKAYFAVQLAYLYRQANNNKKALGYFQKALDSNFLDYNQYLSTLYYIAQTSIEKDDYDKGLELLKQWFSINERPNPSAYILLAHCYYAKNNISLALKYVEKTLSMVTKPKESWLAFAVALYLKEKKYIKAQPYLERLTALYPSTASHWKQLAGVYLYLDQEQKAFVTLDMAYKMGHLTNKAEYLNLISLYIEQGLPYQGAKLLQKKMKQNIVPQDQKSLELIAGAFYLAREGKQSLVYLKQASKTATESKFFLSYGQKLLDQEEWIQAKQAFKKALETKDIKETIEQIENYKKSLAKSKAIKPFQKNTHQELKPNSDSEKTKSAGKAIKSDSEKTIEKQEKAPVTNYLEHIYLGIGIALYNQKKYESALLYFRKSIEVKDTFLSGYQWIDYAETSLQGQKKKQNQLN